MTKKGKKRKLIPLNIQNGETCLYLGENFDYTSHQENYSTHLPTKKKKGISVQTSLCILEISKTQSEIFLFIFGDI